MKLTLKTINTFGRLWLFTFLKPHLWPVFLDTYYCLFSDGTDLFLHLYYLCLTFIPPKTLFSQYLVWAISKNLFVRLVWLVIENLPSQTDLSTTEKHHPRQDIVYAIKYLSSLGHWRKSPSPHKLG